MNQHDHQDDKSSMKVMIYNDTITKSDHALNLRHACNFIIEVTFSVSDLNDSKECSLTYTLVSLNILTYIMNIIVKIDVIFTQSNVYCLEGFLIYVNEIRDYRQKLHEHYQYITFYTHCVSKHFLETISHCLIVY